VGKTELAKALAEQLFGDEKALLRFNMSEFKEEHSVSKLIGAPAGYVGYEEGGILTNKVREKPYSVLLFDEIEKAHPKIFDLFLQVLDDGMLTDAYGHTVDFKNTIILMTSNIGSQEIMDSLQANQVSLPDLYAVEKEGVAENIMDKKEVESSQKKRNRRPKKTLVEKAEIQNASALAKKAELRAIVDELTLEFLRPELVNRFDGNLLFNPMSPEMFKEILDLKLRKKSKQIFEMNGIMITFTNAAKNLLAHKGRDPANGARPIDRAIEKYFVDPLAKEIIGKRFTEGNEVAVDLDLIL
jgi:ATP-dependent Clp protease ATP-binding subunit ClpA